MYKMQYLKKRIQTANASANYGQDVKISILT